MSKTTGGATTTYVYDAMNQLIAEYGTPSAPDSGTKYISVDHLGSTRLVTDTSSPTLNQEICYDYLPFGELIPSGTDGRSGCYGSAATPLTQKFTGKQRDAESGLDFFEARYMASGQGRFTSPDEFTGGAINPFTDELVGELGPLWYADINNPQSINKYAYVYNNPLRYTDPNGHCVEPLSAVFCIAVGIGIEKTFEKFLDWRQQTDETQTYISYYDSLLNHALQVCSTGSPECAAAIAAVQRAQKGLVKSTAVQVFPLSSSSALKTD